VAFISSRLLPKYQRLLDIICRLEILKLRDRYLLQTLENSWICHDRICHISSSSWKSAIMIPDYWYLICITDQLLFWIYLAGKTRINKYTHIDTQEHVYSMRTAKLQEKEQAIYSKIAYNSSSTYAGRTTSIPHRLLFTKHGAPMTGVNMSINLRHTCLCRMTVIASHFIDCYRL